MSADHKLLAPAAWRRCALMMLALAVPALVLFGRGLFSPDLVASDAGKDIFTFYYHRYAFACEFLRAGAVPLWNPFIHCGTPAVSTFQYSFWYPPHWLGALLPVSLLINWMFFLHTWLAGAAMCWWNIFRGRSAVAALAAGVIYMMCGPLFAKVPVGDSPHFYVMALAPLVFLGIDGWLRRARLRWLALAAGAAALQLLAGYPPLALYTALGAGGYSLLELTRRWRSDGEYFNNGSARHDQSATVHRRRHYIKLAVGLLAVWPLALAVAAVDILPGLALLPETTRAGALSGNFAIVGAISPEQLPLLVAPKIFGGFGDMVWWGNEHFYSVVAFTGAGGLLLAALGWLRGCARGERWRFAVLLCVPLLVALGANSPLFTPLNAALPMFSRLRAVGRVAFLFALFAAPFAAVGFDCMINAVKRAGAGARGNINRHSHSGIGIIAMAAGALLLCVGAALLGGWGEETFRALVNKIITHPGYGFAQNRDSVQWWWLAQNCAGAGLLSGGAWLAWFGGLFCFAGVGARFLSPAPRVALFSALLLCSVAAEMLCFAKPIARWFPREAVEYPGLANFAKQHRDEGAWRDLNLVNRSADMLLKIEGLWGYEALMLKRHAELMAFSQGLAPELGNEDMPQFRQNSRLFQLLRGRYLFLPTVSGIQISALQNDPLPRFLVVPKYRVLADRDEILRTLSAADFDFRREVILEHAPGFSSPAAAGEPVFSVKVLSASASRWTVEVTTSAPGILLMTDSYAKGWRATALAGGAQSAYELQPADWAVRGIPLTVAGRHILEIKYTSPGFAVGLGVTLSTLVALMVFAARSVRRSRA